MTFARLTVIFSLLALLISRVTLVGHEFIGHGAAAIAVGGDVIDHRLFLFGGGWIRYVRDTPFDLTESVIISLGGIGLELALAIAALIAARFVRRGSLLQASLGAFGALDAIHAGFYIATGTHHGYGDGRAIAAALGDEAVLLVAPLSVAVVAAAYLLTAWWIARLGAWLPDVSRRGFVIRVAGAALIAAAVHGGLMLGERQLVSDPTYADIMRHEAERVANREAEAIARTRPLTDEQLEALRDRLRAENEPFPLLPVLLVAVGIAVLAGVWRGSRPRESSEVVEPPSRKSVARLAMALLASLAVVLVLRAPW